MKILCYFPKVIAETGYHQEGAGRWNDFQLEFDKSGRSKKYKIEGICDSIIYFKKAKSGH